MEKHASHRKKTCYVNFLQKILKKNPTKPHLESGQSILVLFCHSDGWGELVMVINKVCGFGLFQGTTTNKR